MENNLNDIEGYRDSAISKMIGLFKSFEPELHNRILSGFLRQLKEQTEYDMTEYYKGLSEFKPDIEKVSEELANLKALLNNICLPHQYVVSTYSELRHNCIIQMDILQTLKDETGSEYIHPAKINKTTN